MTSLALSVPFSNSTRHAFDSFLNRKIVDRRRYHESSNCFFLSVTRIPRLRYQKVSFSPLSTFISHPCVVLRAYSRPRLRRWKFNGAFKRLLSRCSTWAQTAGWRRRLFFPRVLPDQRASSPSRIADRKGFYCYEFNFRTNSQPPTTRAEPPMHREREYLEGWARVGARSSAVPCPGRLPVIQ